eukprot:COSAG06_NODE_1705_length_8649_cov_1044.307018_1_plen_187_part_00
MKQEAPAHASSYAPSFQRSAASSSSVPGPMSAPQHRQHSRHAVSRESTMALHCVKLGRRLGLGTQQPAASSCSSPPVPASAIARTVHHPEVVDFRVVLGVADARADVVALLDEREADVAPDVARRAVDCAARRRQQRTRGHHLARQWRTCLSGGGLGMRERRRRVAWASSANAPATGPSAGLMGAM